MLFHPGGAGCAQFGHVPDCADDTVEDDAIEPVERQSQFLGRLDEEEIEQFVDVILVHERLIQDPRLRRPSVRGGRIHAVQIMGQGPAEEGDAAGDHHER